MFGQPTQEPDIKTPSIDQKGWNGSEFSQLNGKENEKNQVNLDYHSAGSNNKSGWKDHQKMEEYGFMTYLHPSRQWGDVGPYFMQHTSRVNPVESIGKVDYDCTFLLRYNIIITSVAKHDKWSIGLDKICLVKFEQNEQPKEAILQAKWAVNIVQKAKWVKNEL